MIVMIKYQIWVIPGVPPTGKYANLLNVVVKNFCEGKNSHEYICWDQALLLVQVGLLDLKRSP